MNSEATEKKKRNSFFIGRMCSAIGAQLTFTMLFTALTLPDRREPYIPLVLTALGVGVVFFSFGLTITVMFVPNRSLKEAARDPYPDELFMMKRASRSMFIGMLTSLGMALLFILQFHLPLPGIFLVAYAGYLGFVSRGFRKGLAMGGKEKNA